MSVFAQYLSMLDITAHAACYLVRLELLGDLCRHYAPFIWCANGLCKSVNRAVVLAPCEPSDRKLALTPEAAPPKIGASDSQNFRHSASVKYGLIRYWESGDRMSLRIRHSPAIQ
eukprot:1625202-Pleurochrysis_carterae.AAC.2